MAEKNICIIVPTIRNFECMRDYYTNAHNHGFNLSRTHTLLITEDFCDKRHMEAMLSEENVSGEVFNHTDRLAWFEDNAVEGFADLIPRRSHAETSFGLLYMQAHPQYEYGFFIDDDTLPVQSVDFFGTHIHNLRYEGPVDIVHSDKRWVNVLYQNFERHGLHPRGYPYAALHENIVVERGTVRDIVCSQGLWTNVPDLDAVRILMDGDLQGVGQVRTLEADFRRNFVVAPTNYLTVSSMNLAFSREIIPVFYQLPMDDNPWNIGRFDDIWSGIFLKRAADILGKQIITGHPLCEHNKAPRSTFKDLSAEAPGLELNEHLWELADRAPSAKEWGQLYLNMAKTLMDAALDLPYINREYLTYCANAMTRWIVCCNTLSGRG